MIYYLIKQYYRVSSNLYSEFFFFLFIFSRVLHNNSFIGPIPREIGTLKSLTVLDLGMNRLSGPIPRELGNLTNVIKL